MLSLTLSLCLGGLMADAPRSATLLPEEQAAMIARRDELKATAAPSLAPPIILLSSAVGTVAFAAVMFYVAAVTSLLVGGANVIPMLVVGLVALVVGAGLGVTGGVVLSNMLKERRARTLELRELERQLQPGETPPPPSSVQGPTPALLLATF